MGHAVDRLLRWIAGRPSPGFTHEVPSLDSYWRAFILFGQNVASYKFALGGALPELGAGHEEVSLDELAVPFASRVAEHMRAHDKQGTFERSRFLDACRAFNRGELDEDGLRAKTVQLGFTNVIDAFHVVDGSDVAERFFIDERRTGKGIRLTDRLHALVGDPHHADPGQEVESRWRLVETAWELNLPRQLLTVEFEPAHALRCVAVSCAGAVPWRHVAGCRDAASETFRNSDQPSSISLVIGPAALRGPSPSAVPGDEIVELVPRQATFASLWRDSKPAIWGRAARNRVWDFWGGVRVR
jgi:hypothetical protein